MLNELNRGILSVRIKFIRECGINVDRRGIHCVQRLVKHVFSRLQLVSDILILELFFFFTSNRLVDDDTSRRRLSRGSSQPLLLLQLASTLADGALASYEWVNRF